MSKIYTGYTIARGWKKLTLFEFDAKTHARILVTEIRPLKTLDKVQREQTIRHRMKEHGLPLPPTCFDPK